MSKAARQVPDRTLFYYPGLHLPTVRDLQSRMLFSSLAAYVLCGSPSHPDILLLRRLGRSVGAQLNDFVEFESTGNSQW